MSLAVLAARHCRSGGQRLVGVGGVAAAVKSEQRLGAGILELEADIALAQRRAQHYGKAAELQDAVVGGNDTGPVGAGERDTAARPGALPDKAASPDDGPASAPGEAAPETGVPQHPPARWPGQR